MEAYRFLNPLIASFPRLANTWIHHDETDMDSYIVPVFYLGVIFFSMLPAIPAQAQSSEELDLIVEINPLRASRALAP